MKFTLSFLSGKLSLMISICLPAYNEEVSITSLINDIIKLKNTFKDIKIYVVDDGSTDKTAEILKRYYPGEVIILSHDKNYGLGIALKTAFFAIKDKLQDDDIVITMDADNTHSPEFILLMVQNIRAGNDVVIASRFCSKSKSMGLSLKRNILSICAYLFLKLFFPVKGVKDYTSGYRAYSGKILKSAFEKYKNNFFTVKGFNIQADILIKLSKINARIKEIPFTLRYDLKCGKSKIKIIRTIGEYLSMVVKNRY